VYSDGTQKDRQKADLISTYSNDKNLLCIGVIDATAG
jgi:hypothetical protein